MTSSAVNPLPYPGSYYQLSSSTGTGSQNTNASSGGVQPDITQSLLQALNQAQQGSFNTTGSYMLDLSPQAQNILNSLSNGNTGSGSTSTGSGFTLTIAQKQQVSDILGKYKDAPFTQDTYDQIQNDLQAAGLSPEQLALKDAMRGVNSTQILLDALNGTANSMSISSLMHNEQGNATAYMQQVVSQWQAISTTASASSS